MIKCELVGCDNVARSHGKGKRGQLCNTHHRHRYPRNAGYALRTRNRQRNKRYGITSMDYAKLVQDQASVCGICGDVMGQVNIDHCHATGQVRGLLCSKCNWGLGMFNDDIDLLASAVSYLVNSVTKRCG